jgi:hypothetical protein
VNAFINPISVYTHHQCLCSFLQHFYITGGTYLGSHSIHVWDMLSCMHWLVEDLLYAGPKLQLAQPCSHQQSSSVPIYINLRVLPQSILLSVKLRNCVSSASLTTCSANVTGTTVCQLLRSNRPTRLQCFADMACVESTSKWEYTGSNSTG